MSFIMSRWSNMSSIMLRLPYMSRILFWSIAKYVRILFWTIAKHVYITLHTSDACCNFFHIRPAMVSKHLELVKRQARDRYGRFTSPSSRTAPPPSHRQEVGSSSHHRTAPPPSHCSSSIIWWLECGDVGGASSSDTPRLLLLDPSSYIDECPHVSEVRSYELLLDFNCLV
jgi:hypothetical protein